MEEIKEPVIPAGEGEQTPETKNEPVKEKTFTQAQLDSILKERLEKTKNKSLEEGSNTKTKEICEKYGVANLDELDALISKGKNYDTVFAENKESKVELALSQNKIDPNKYNDIRTYFKGLDQEITNETLQEQLKTHPEWEKKVITVSPIGNDKREIKEEENVKEILKEYWGL